MRFLNFGALLLMAMVAAPASAADNGAAAERTARVVARIDIALQSITTTVRPGRVGYATVWDGNKYVQCRRQSDRSMRCEAAGATMQPSLRAELTGARLDRLAALGWTLDPSFGNYVHVFPADTATADIAAQIVRALADGYGAEPGDLEQATAWIVDVPCPPRNGPSQSLAGLVNDAPTMRPLRACSYTPGAAAPEKVASAAALVARYGETVTAEIRRLRINAQGHVFVIFDSGTGYVQCAPEGPSKTIYCEAQSAENWPALAAVITPERVARLHAAGYADPGRAPNYWKRYPASASADAIAAEILTLLYDVYGYAGASALDIKTE